MFSNDRDNSLKRRQKIEDMQNSVELLLTLSTALINLRASAGAAPSNSMVDVTANLEKTLGLVTADLVSLVQ